jgi:aryl-alcohol dehydrogenase-like predicted oxidoreductase
MLTGRYASAGDRPSGENDFRAQAQPRFRPENFENNINLVDAVKEIAIRKECAPAQVALAWVLEQGDHIVAIPGTTRLANLRTNLGALDCRLTGEERATLDSLADNVLGARY